VDDIYGGTFLYFNRVVRETQMGIVVEAVDMTDLEAIENKIKPNTKIVWLEALTNPTLTVIDIRAVSQLVKKVNPETVVIVDNTLLSPILQRPISLGADLVIHSATKYLNGHCDVVMGVVALNDKNLYERLSFLQCSIGSVPSPFDCYLVFRGIKTLHLRMQRQSLNALQVARFLESHPLVEAVFYPGLTSHKQHEIARMQQSGYGGVVSFRLNGTPQQAQQVVEETKLFRLAMSLGGVESLIEIPAIMTHSMVGKEAREALGITDTFIRLSCGIEDGDDLVEDLRQAIEKAVFNVSL